MKPIDKGTTWIWTLKFWDDAAKTEAKNVSSYAFALNVRTTAGVSVLALDNDDFAIITTNERRVTLSNVTTDGLTAGTHLYEFTATLSGVTELWKEGTITIEE